MKLTGDYHTHTYYSHGKGSPRENVLAAVALGLKSIAITEHASAHIFYGVRNEKLLRLRREVDALKKEFSGDIEVLMGLECNLTGDGKCDIPDDPFDVLILGFHKGVMPRDMFSVRAMLQLIGIGKDPTGNAEALMRAAEKHGVTMLSHPGLYIPMDIEVLAPAAARLNIPLEINGSRVTLTKEQLVRGKELGASFIINSDAHRPEDVGRVEKAIAAAVEADVWDRVLNLLP